MTSVSPSPATDLAPATPVPPGVYWTRYAGLFFGGVILGWALTSTPVSPGWWTPVRMTIFPLFGLLVALPWARLPDGKVFRRLFGLLIASAIIFTFTMMIDTMYMIQERGSEGLRPRVPGFRATMIFVSLAQIPAILFERRPERLQ